MFLFFDFNYTSCGQHNVSEYGVQEANAIGVHEVTAYGDFLLFIQNTLGDNWYYDRLHMLDLVADCFALKFWITGMQYTL